jgi:hypothetical protein
MTQKMSSQFVRTQIETSLELLASNAADQLKFLQQRAVAPSTDELALALNDFIVMLPAAVRGWGHFGEAGSCYSTSQRLYGFVQRRRKTRRSGTWTNSAPPRSGMKFAGEREGRFRPFAERPRSRLPSDGMLRLHLSGHTNTRKRLLIHTAGSNRG